MKKKHSGKLSLRNGMLLLSSFLTKLPRFYAELLTQLILLLTHY